MERSLPTVPIVHRNKKYKVKCAKSIKSFTLNTHNNKYVYYILLNVFSSQLSS